MLNASSRGIIGIVKRMKVHFLKALCKNRCLWQIACPCRTLNGPKLLENKFSGTWGGTRRVRIKKMCKWKSNIEKSSVWSRAMINFKLQMLYLCAAYFWCKTACRAKRITLRGTFSTSHIPSVQYNIASLHDIDERTVYDRCLPSLSLSLSHLALSLPLSLYLSLVVYLFLTLPNVFFASLCFSIPRPLNSLHRSLHRSRCLSHSPFLFLCSFFVVAQDSLQDLNKNIENIKKRVEINLQRAVNRQPGSRPGDS